MEAKIGMMSLPAKEGPGLPASTRSQERGINSFFLDPSEGFSALAHQFWGYSPQICQTINLCCFKALSLWYFAGANLGS